MTPRRRAAWVSAVVILLAGRGGQAGVAGAESADPVAAKTSLVATRQVALAGPGEPIARDRWPEAFHRANEAYGQGRFEDAVRGYSGLIAGGLENGALWHNLGNAYVRSGQHGRAIASYLRARALLPRDGDLAANLAVARQKARDETPPAAATLWRTLLFWHFEASLAELVWVALAANAIGWGAGLARLRTEREAFGWLAALAFVVLLGAGGSALVRVYWPARVAVVTVEEADVRSAPDQTAVTLFRLHEGAEVRVLAAEQGWIKVELGEERRGWVEPEAVAVVEGSG